MTLCTVRAIAMTQPLVADLPSTLDLIAYQARVSNPTGQQKQLDGDHKISAKRFADSCMKRGEWSVFQMANVNLEITGPRDILRQFTRHESMAVVEHDLDLTFLPDGFDKHAGGVQEFSQRYAAVPKLLKREGRAATGDKQISETDYSTDAVAVDSNNEVAAFALREYEMRLREGEHPETARVILPEGLTPARLYVNGTVRSYLHYLKAREEYVTQKEHRELAAQIRAVLHDLLPELF